MNTKVYDPIKASRRILIETLNVLQKHKGYKLNKKQKGEFGYIIATGFLGSVEITTSLHASVQGTQADSVTLVAKFKKNFDSCPEYNWLVKHLGPHNEMAEQRVFWVRFNPDLLC